MRWTTRQGDLARGLPRRHLLDRRRTTTRSTRRHAHTARRRRIRWTTPEFAPGIAFSASRREATASRAGREPALRRLARPDSCSTGSPTSTSATYTGRCRALERLRPERATSSTAASSRRSAAATPAVRFQGCDDAGSDAPTRPHPAGAPDPDAAHHPTTPTPTDPTPTAPTTGSAGSVPHVVAKPSAVALGPSRIAVRWARVEGGDGRQGHRLRRQGVQGFDAREKPDWSGRPRGS